MSAPFFVCAVVTALSAMISLGFSLVAIPRATGNARTLACYACARSMALALISLGSFVTGSSQWLVATAIAMIIVQGCDGLIGATIKDPVKTFGPAGTALANLAALAWFGIQS